MRTPPVKKQAPYSARSLSDIIFDGVNTDTEAKCARISKENAALMPDAPDGFFCQKMLFTHTEKRVRSQAKFGSCHESILPKAMAMVQFVDRYKFEKIRTQQALAILLFGAQTPQDIRDALPEFLIPYVKELATLPRTREEAWTLEDRPLHKAQYVVLRDLIEFYLVNKLLY